MKFNYVQKLIVFAITLMVVSCSKTEEDVSVVKPAVKLDVKSIVRKVSLVNQDIPFYAINDKGEQIEGAKFYVDGEEWNGEVFKSDKEGEFTLKMTYTKKGESVEQEEEFRVVVPKHNVVIDDFTGAWCQYCPGAVLTLEELGKKTKNVVPIAIHVSGLGLPDKIVFDKAGDLGQALGVDLKSAPTVLINRGDKWSKVADHEAVDYDVVLSKAGVPVNIGLGIYTVLEGNSLKVQVSYAYGNGLYEEGDRLVVYLLEDKIKHSQRNAFKDKSGHPLEGLGDPILGYNNNHVLRKSFTNTIGNLIKNVKPLEEVKVDFEQALTLGDTPGSEYNNYNKDNLVVAAIVVDKDNNAKQAQYVHVKAGGESYVLL